MYEESSSSSAAAASTSTSTSKQQRLNKSAQESRVETGAEKRLIIKNKKFLSASVNSTPTTTSTKKSSKIYRLLFQFRLGFFSLMVVLMILFKVNKLVRKAKNADKMKSITMMVRPVQLPNVYNLLVNFILYFMMFILLLLEQPKFVLSF